MHAVRIGDGAIVTGPGETFTEYGIAVKERSPGAPTLYAGYTNGLLGYLPTAAEYAFGGYEAGYGHKSVGLPSLFDPSVERILVETGRAARGAALPRGGAVGRRATAGPRAGRCRGCRRRRLEHPSRVASEGAVSTARIGVIGAGFWASYQYLPFYRDHAEVELVGVVRKDDSGLDAFRREFGLEVATSSVDEFLSAGVDGVVVSSPHSLHCEHAVAALEAGSHVLVEKPMTVTLADAHTLAAVAATAGREVGVAHGWNYSRLTAWAKDALERRRLGRITAVTAYMSSCLTDLFSGNTGYAVVDVGGFPVEVETETWTRADAGGGYLYGQLSHLLGLGLWLVPHEPEDVLARASLLDNGVDLDIQVSVGLAGGVIGSFSGQGHEPWGRPHACDLRIAGEDGVLMLDFDRVQAQLLLEKDKERAEWLTLEPDPPPTEADSEYTCDGCAQFLVDVCLGREAVNCAPLDLGVRTVAVMEAAWQSVHSREIVRIAELVA